MVRESDAFLEAMMCIKSLLEGDEGEWGKRGLGLVMVPPASSSSTWLLKKDEGAPKRVCVCRGKAGEGRVWLVGWLSLLGKGGDCAGLRECVIARPRNR